MTLTIGTLSSTQIIPVRVTYTPTIGKDGGGGSTLTFTDVPVGSAYSDRLVIAFFGVGTGSNVKATSLLNGTIGGVTANIGYYGYGQSSGMNGTGMLYAMVPSGTTATVFVNLGADPGDGQGQTCACYSVDASTLNSIHPIFDSVVTTGSTAVTSLSISSVPYKPGGLIIGSSVTDNSSNIGNFTNITKDSYEAFEDNDRSFYTGSIIHTGPSTSKTVSATFSVSNGRRAFGVASWR